MNQYDSMYHTRLEAWSEVSEAGEPTMKKENIKRRSASHHSFIKPTSSHTYNFSSLSLLIMARVAIINYHAYCYLRSVVRSAYS